MSILRILHIQGLKMTYLNERFVKNAENSPIFTGKSGFFVNTSDSLAYKHE
jgi:hypothetical protein